ncbi:energy transducer TonB [Leptotrichia massiliensis]|uniref:energy transducer TonB n=1 Tax=Leptotrichia massiliensis TaxID=1852388 RepID=UPI0028E5F8D1|nr:energy transducer TonB [Leptotrichia massiliensis]
MKYYIISAAINLGILLIPIATPVLKQKLEEKKEKQTIVVDLKNSILEENKTKSTVDTDSNEESNGTAGLQKANPQNKNNAISEAQNIEPSKQPKNPKQPKLTPAQPIQPKQPQQPAPQPPKVPQNTILKEHPKSSSSPIIPPVTSTPKNATQPVISQSTGNSASTKPVQNTITASNSTISNNSGHKNTPSSSGTSHGNKNGNTTNGSITGNKNGNGTNGNSTSSGNGNDKKSGSTRGGGCRRGVDFSVSYNSHLEVPTANQRLKRKETIVATIRFTRGGSVSIQSVTGGNSQSQAAARRAASNVHVSFLTNNCSSGIVTLQFNIN